MALHKNARLVSSVVLLLFLVLLWALYPEKHVAEKQVYSAVLDELKNKIPVKDFTYYSHPSNCRGVSYDYIPLADKAAFKHFFIENDVVLGEPLYLYFLTPEFSALSQQESASMFSGGITESMKISGKLINLSRIGFNLAKTRALLCVESQESGDLVYLEKQEGEWRVIKWQYIW